MMKHAGAFWLHLKLGWASFSGATAAAFFASSFCPEPRAAGPIPRESISHEYAVRKTKHPMAGTRQRHVATKLDCL